VIFSNELLDAFPVHRATVREGELKEFFVDLDSDRKFVWVLKSPSTRKLQEYCDLCEIDLREGQIADINLEVEPWSQKVVASLRSGYVVTVDYGASAQDLHISCPDEPRYFGTLRGFREHALIDDVLTEPGAQDLTATVNWTFVEKVGQRLRLEVVDFKPQDKFLLDEGLLSQLEIETQLVDSDSERLRLSTTAREMILPDGMAAKFQVMVQRKAN
jgi:SAM-dependent MidA family methyltransferase